MTSTKRQNLLRLSKQVISQAGCLLLLTLYFMELK